MESTTTQSIYGQLGISRQVWELGQKTEEKLKDRFCEFDRTAEYNQMKVIKAMQDNRVSDVHLQLQPDTVTMILDGILWRMCMPVCSIRRRRWSALR